MGIQRVSTNGAGKARQYASYEATTDLFVRWGKFEINEQTGKEELVFLPGVYPLDPNKKNQVSGQGEYQDALLHGNELLDSTYADAQELDRGEGAIFDEFKMYVFRKKPSQEENHIMRERSKTKMTFINVNH